MEQEGKKIDKAASEEAETYEGVVAELEGLLAGLKVEEVEDEYFQYLLRKSD